MALVKRDRLGAYARRAYEALEPPCSRSDLWIVELVRGVLGRVVDPRSPGAEEQEWNLRPPERIVVRQRRDDLGVRRTHDHTGIRTLERMDQRLRSRTALCPQREHGVTDLVWKDVGAE